ncbi:MAG: hypothetical protein S4CHLAM2_11190 [Chlamydiales bacterium]|nr:hypothetical protein [Chlamydiales bacterium]
MRQCFFQRFFWRADLHPLERRQCKRYGERARKDGRQNGPSRIRTCDRPLRRRVLYPLSYRSSLSGWAHLSELESKIKERFFWDGGVSYWGMDTVYLGLGGNFEGSLAVMRRCVRLLSEMGKVAQFRCSRVYRTTPVSLVPMRDFLNAVCGFECGLPLMELWEKLKELEKALGKVPKPKHAPRLIDIDLLFYGETVYDAKELKVPHPKWHERLFVLAPLAEIAEKVPFDLDVGKMLEKFSNPHGEQVVVCDSLM